MLYNTKNERGIIMTVYENYSLFLQASGSVLSFIATICSIVAIIFTYKNLKEIKNQFFEQNRGNIIFFVSHDNLSVVDSIYIKNFGNSPAKLLSLTTSPQLDWSKAGKQSISKQFNIDGIKNVLLAPNQHIQTIFDFSSFSESKFSVTLCYETCKRQYSDTYEIDLEFTDKTLTISPEVKDPVKAMNNIAKSINTLSDKFI